MNNQLSRALSKKISFFICLTAVIFLVALLLYFFYVVFFSFSPLWSKTETLTLNSSFFLIKTTLFTIIQAFCSVLIACLLGIPLGFFIAKRQFFLAQFLKSLSGIPLSLPILLIILGYIETFGINGYYNKLLFHLTGNRDFSIQFLYSFIGIILCQGFYNFPLVMISVARSWETISPTQAQSAQMLGASKWKVFKDITIHQLMGGILAGAIPVFIFCFFSFLIVLVFGKIGTTTLEVLLYNQGKNMLNYKNAALIALIETIFALIFISIYGKFEKKATKTQNLDFSAKKRKAPLSKKERIVLIAILILIFLFFIIPLLSVVFSSFCQKTHNQSSFTLSLWKKTLESSQFLIALQNSLSIACITATFSVCMAFTFSILIKKTKEKMQTILKVLPFIPMAISSVLLGIGFSHTHSSTSLLTLTFAQTMIMWPFAFRQIFACIEKIPENIIYSEQLLSRTKTFGIFSLYIPYGKQSIQEAWGLIFAMSLGDATLPLILGISNCNTLSLSTYKLVAAYHFGEASVIGVVIAIISLGILYLTKQKDKKNVF